MPKDSYPRTIYAALKQKLDAAGYGDGDILDVIAFLKRSGVDLTNIPNKPNTPLGVFTSDPWPTVAINERLAGNRFAQKMVATHEAAHYILSDSRISAAGPAFHAPPHLQSATEEIKACHLERVLLFPPKPFHRAILRPGVTNWDLAREFDTTVDAPVLRSVESICSMFTRDPDANIDAIANFLRHSSPRIQILAEDDLGPWIDTDPPIMPDELLDTPKIRDLQASIENIRDEYTITMRIKSQATSDLRAFFDQTPVAISAKLIQLLRGLSPNVLAYFFLKLGHPTKACAILAEIKFGKPTEEAEASCIRARAATMMNPGKAGLRKAESLYRRALTFDPESIEALLGLANTLLQLGLLEQCDEFLRRAMATGEDYYRVVYYLGKRQEVAGNLDGAKMKYALVWSIGEHRYRKKAGAKLADLLSAENWETGRAMYATLFREFPYAIDGLNDCVGHMLKHNERAAATEQLVKLMRCAPLQAWCYEQLANIYFKERKPEHAESMRTMATLLRRVLKAGIN